MNVAWQIHAILGLGLFAVGTIVGSFLNVCIYRIPWEKSVIWPASHCPRCWKAIAPQDNIPVLSWLALRGECRNCGEGISIRYPLVEALVGLLFAGVYVVDVVYGPSSVSRHIAWEQVPARIPLQVVYHLILVALMVVATFIDYDLQIIPDQITVTGMVIGVGMGMLFPGIRPEPSTAASLWDGLRVGIGGLLTGGGLVLFFRVVGRLIFRKEAMGLGDVTLLGMIGAFLGWQAAVLTFFIAPFFGLGHALWKAGVWLAKLVSRRPTSAADREMAFGPYLSMAALALLLSWPWIWPNWAKANFDVLRMVFFPG